MKRILATAIAVLALATCAAAQPYKGVVAKHHRHLVAQVMQPAQVAAVPTTTDACHPGVWHSVTPQMLEETSGLVKQYQETKEQIAKVQALKQDAAVTLRQEGSWFVAKMTPQEVRDALSRRLADLLCKLQARGMTMEPPKNSS